MSGSTMLVNGQDTSLAALIEIARRLGSSLDLNTLLQQIEQATLRLLDCERVSIFLADGRRQQLCSQLATDAPPIQLPIDRGIAGTAYRARTVINVPDVQVDPRFYPDIDQRTGFRTRCLLCLPLLGHDAQPIGVLEALNKRGSQFTATDEELAAALGALTGIALQRQALLDEHVFRLKVERELEVARTIQRSLLPDTDPHITGFDIAGWSQAADATGGDFYDYLTLPDGRPGFVLADVSGHGLGSSLLASECRALIRAIAATTADLSIVAAKTNELLYTDLRSGRFVTMFLGALDASRSRMEYVSAGHPALLITAAETFGCHEIDSTTLPLGIVPHWKGATTATLDLDPGDTLLLLTDGVYDWEDAAQEPFGIDRAVATVRRCPKMCSADLIRELHAAVLAFTNGATQVDDVTAVVIRRI